MDKSSAITTARYSRHLPRAATSGPLLELLLFDVATDVEVVTRELGLRDEMRERLLRALDRLNCAQAILDAQRKRLLGSSCSNEVCERMSKAVRVLADNWPKDYPEGAVEWLLVGNAGPISPVCSELPGQLLATNDVGPQTALDRTAGRRFSAASRSSTTPKCCSNSFT